MPPRPLDPQESRARLEAARLTIETFAIDDPTNGGHLVMWARARTAARRADHAK